ncbi:MAG: endonuclease/exonuclease/phosphatase family protein [Deltaproteobacteria bacterium]|nr:endonuclease/exonuclease/phosphatase family protein [Deltaproteobacteria bacterium]
MRRLAVLGVLVLLACTVGAMYSAKHFVLEWLCHFRLQYIAFGLLLLLPLLLTRAWIWSLLVFALIAANLLPCLSWSFSPRPKVADHAPKLRVLLANLYSGNADATRLRRLVIDERPDLLALLEVTPSWRERLTFLERRYPHRLIHSQQGNFGIAIYSRLPLEDARAIRFYAGDPVSLAATVVTAKLRVQLLVVHPVPPINAKMAFARDRLLAHAAAHLNKRFADPRLLLGDLNATMWSPALDVFGAIGMENARRGIGLLPTWPVTQPLLQLPLDHAYHDRRLRIAALWRGPDIGSDHFPLLIDVARAALR